MLETIREYGLEQLAAAGETEAMHRRHAQFFLALAERPETDRLARLWRLEREHDNLRAALAWCQEDPIGGQVGLRLGSAVFRLWYWHGYMSEGWRWLTGALSHPGAVTRTAARGRALFAAAMFAHAGGVSPEARRCLAEESLAIAREFG